MAEDGTRLKKFLSDQESAVSLARELPDGSDVLRVDAINVALALANVNAQASGANALTMADLLKDAVEAERFLRGE